MSLLIPATALLYFASALLSLSNSSVQMLTAMSLALGSFEAVRLLRSKDAGSPLALFFLGWVFPFQLACLPIELIVFTLDTLPVETYQLYFLIAACFYFVSSASGLLVKNSKSIANKSLTLPYVVPPWIIFALAALSTAGYLIALGSHGFQFPLLQPRVTEAAAGFFSLKGSSSVFGLGIISCLLLVVYAKQVGSSQRLLMFGLIAAVALFPTGQILYGKRMGVFLTVTTLAVLYVALQSAGKLRVPKKKRLLIIGLVLSAIVLGNGYLRAQYGYYEFWEGSSNLAVKGVLVFALLQPIIYTHETFSNMGNLLADAGWWGGVMSYGDLMSVEAGRLTTSMNSLYGDLRSKGKMVTFLGPFLVTWGVMAAIVYCSALFSVVWFFYNRSSGIFFLLAYAMFGARLGVMWTANLFLNISLYYNLAVLLLLVVLLDVCRLCSNKRSRSEIARLQ